MASPSAILFDEAFLHRLEVLAIVARKVFAGRVRAERRSRKVGAGIEFADHRDYAPGDDLRYLDWNLYGRLDRPLLRLFEEEEDLSIYLLLDASASMRSGTVPKLDQAMRISAALAYVALANLDRVALVPFGEHAPEPLPAARGRGQIFKIFRYLEALEARGETRLEKAAQALVHRHKRRGLVIVASDLYDDGASAAIDLLRHHRFEPVVVHVVDEADARPTLRGELEIVDSETGEVRAVTVSAGLVAAVGRAHAARLAAASSFCGARAVPYLRAPVSTPFDDLVLGILRRGGLLR
jgi:uncharacterized protein (DUF58 family)